MDQINAVGYIRVSTEEQGQSGLGLESQRRQIVAYCTARGMNLVSIYEDVMTGREAQRPALSALRADVATAKGTATPIHCFVVMKFDRLSRVAFDMLSMIREFASHGVQFVSVLEGLDATTPMGKAMLTIIAAFAELERDEISARTKRALAVRRDRGQRNCRAPFGFRALKGGGLMPYPQEIELLDTIWRLKYVEGYGVCAISKYLGFHRIEMAPNTVLDRLKPSQCMHFLDPRTRAAAEKAGRVAKPLPADSLDRYDPSAEIAKWEGRGSRRKNPIRA